MFARLLYSLWHPKPTAHIHLQDNLHWDKKICEVLNVEEEKSFYLLLWIMLH